MHCKVLFICICFFLLVFIAQLLIVVLFPKIVVFKVKAVGSVADMPSDPPLAGWTRISNVKPADPHKQRKTRGPAKPREKPAFAGNMQKYLKVIILSAEYAC